MTYCVVCVVDESEPFEIGETVEILPLKPQKNATTRVDELLALLNNSVGRIVGSQMNKKMHRMEWVVQSVNDDTKKLRIKTKYLRSIVPTIQIHDTSKMNGTVRIRYLQQIESEPVAFTFDVEQTGSKLMVDRLLENSKSLLKSSITPYYSLFSYFEFAEKRLKREVSAQKVASALSLMPIRISKKIFVATKRRLNKTKHFSKAVDKIEKTQIEDDQWLTCNNLLKITRRYNGHYTFTDKLLSALVTLDAASKHLLLRTIWMEMKIFFDEWRTQMQDEYGSKDVRDLLSIDVISNYHQNVFGRACTMHILLPLEMNSDVMKKRSFIGHQD